MEGLDLLTILTLPTRPAFPIGSVHGPKALLTEWTVRRDRRESTLQYGLLVQQVFFSFQGDLTRTCSGCQPTIYDISVMDVLRIVLTWIHLIFSWIGRYGSKPKRQSLLEQNSHEGMA